MNTIAIPAYNEGARIGGLLELLGGHPPGQWREILVCDSLSTDHTAEVVRAWQERIPHLRLIPASEPGKASAWNCLMKAAQSPHVIFLDADVMPHEDCLRRLVAAAEEGGQLIYGCRRLPTQTPGGGLSSRFLRVLEDPVIELCLAGGCYAVRREPLLDRLQARGFSAMPDVFAEDTWLQSLLKPNELCLLHDCVIETEPRTFDVHLRVEARRTLIPFELERRFPELARDLRRHYPEGLSRFAQARLVFTWKGPWKTRLRWYLGGGIKALVNLCYARPIARQAFVLREAYLKHGGSWVLRHLASTSRAAELPPPGPVRRTDHEALPPSYTIRRGEATARDAAHYAALVNLSTGSQLPFLFGSRWKALLMHLYLEEDTLHHFRHVYFLQEGSEIAGHIAFYPYAVYARGHEATALRTRRFLGWRGMRAAALTKIRKACGIEFGSVAPGEVYLASGALYEKWRGRHLFRHLVAFWVAAAETAGSTRCSVDVDPRNEIAQRIYRLAGFRFDPGRNGRKSRKVHRMIKDLAAPKPMASNPPSTGTPHQ